MCVSIGSGWPVLISVGLTNGEVASLIGLLLNLTGVFLLSVSGVFGEKPLRRLRELHNLERNELEEGKVSYDMAAVRTIDRPHHSPFANQPITTGDYDALRSRLVRAVSGAVLVVVGLVFQAGGVIIC